MASRARRRKLATRGPGTLAVATDRVFHPAIARELRGKVRKLVRLRHELAIEQAARDAEPQPTGIILTDGDLP